MTPEHIRLLDCTGLYCPEPVFRLCFELDDLELCQTIKVMADDPATEKDLKRLIKRFGHEMLEMNTDTNPSIHHR